MAFKPEKTGFTLIELVVVIVIIAVLATVSLPRFVSLGPTAKSNSDNAVISALKIALETDRLNFIAQGGNLEPVFNGYYSGNPFDLFEKPPPYTVETFWDANTQDNIHWRIYSMASDGYFLISSPYCNIGFGETLAEPIIPANPKGTVWKYLFGVGLSIAYGPYGY